MTPKDSSKEASAKPTVFIGADHAGFDLKEKLKKYLTKKGYTVKDQGAAKYNKDDDYPVFGAKVANAVAASLETGVGIAVCGSAEGICIAANKINGARAVAPYTNTLAKLSRMHNNANILCISGGKTLDKISGLGMSWRKVKSIVDTWLETPFSGEERHERRIRMLNKLR